MVETVDPRRLVEILGLHAIEFEVAQGGADTAIWRVRTEREEYALRVFRPGEERRARLERDAMRVAAAGGIPVPEVRGETAWQGRAVLLLTWCPGSVMMKAIKSRPWTILSLAHSFGRLQKALNDVPAPTSVVEARDWIEWAGPGEDALKARLRDVALSPPRLLHMDYHPYNVMVHGNQAASVLDWANVRGGDPRSDYARTLTLLRLAPQPPNLVKHFFSPLRRTLEWGWRRGYGAVEGAPEDMSLFYAWAGAAMLQDLEPKLGKERLWMRAEHLEPIRRWTDMWKRRAGIR